MDTIEETSIRSESEAVAGHQLWPWWLPVLAGLAVAAAPLSLLIWNQDWFFTRIGYIDPWNYVWFFQFYADPHFWPGAYKLARLPWVLSGWLAFRLVSPVAAAYILHGSYLVLAVGGMFAAAYLAFRDLLVALTAALMLGFLPSFHGSGGWDYHNTAAGAFYLLTAALLQWAVISPARRGPAMALCGAAFALSVHSNITFINFLPILVLHYCVSIWYVERRARGAATYLLPFFYGTAAAAGVTVLLSAVNVAAGRNPVFFYALVRIVFNYTTDSRLQAPFWEPWSALWFLKPSFGFIAVPATALVGGLITLIWKSMRSSAIPLTASRLAAFLFIGEAGFLAILWIAWQAQGQTALNWEYFAYPLIPPSVLAFSSMLFLGSKRFSVQMSLLLAALGWVAILASLAAGGRHWIEGYISSSQHWWLATTAAILLAALGAHRILRCGIAGWLAFYVLFALGNDAVAGYPASYEADATCRTAAAEYQTVVNGMRAVEAADPDFRTPIRIWADESERMTIAPGCQARIADFAYSIGITAWDHLTSAFPFRPIDALPDQDLVAKSRSQALFVVPTEHAQTIDDLKERFLHAGIQVDKIEDRSIGQTPVALHLYILKIRSP